MVAECAEMCRARAHDCITHERQEVSDGISVEKGRASEKEREGQRESESEREPEREGCDGISFKLRERARERASERESE